MRELEGQVALVTGASRGIGRAIAGKLAALGAAVVCTGRDEAALAETVAMIEADGGTAELAVFDVTDAQAAAAAVKDAHGRHGRLDILVNNAGLTRDQILVRMKEEDWRAVMAADLDGVFHVTQPAAKIMMRQRSGRIVNISSVIGLMGNPGQANYAAAKAALIGFTKALARELGSRNVTVNAVAPGYIETAMTESLTDQQREALLKALAIPRLGTPEDVAEAVAFLAGPGGSYITGTVLNVSGGLYI
ncbi:MAG TPA: 3-oxoacyl-[acyl-carrier-protein] reductase [Acidobacteria bacterium]|nr:3-oxoacyl-[acyl-carrier-protein] reductase [Acidobacteriota bacterium]